MTAKSEKQTLECDRVTVARTRNENATESKALVAQGQEHRLTFTAPGSQ